MGWRNTQQPTNTVGIPQNMIEDPEGFINAFGQASTPQQKEQAYTNYIFPTWNGADSRSVVSGKLLGDNSNYVSITDSTTDFQLKSYYNGSSINFSQDGFKTADYTICYVALVDDDTQVSFFSCFIRYRQNQACGQAGGTNPIISGTMSQQIYTILISNELEVTVTSNGGGATHIAKVTGHLSALSNNLSDILIVAGGGGGGMIIDSVAYDGADAGGISGSGTNSANQTTGYAFGQGESGSGVSGGGGGLYGGYKGVSS